MKLVLKMKDSADKATSKTFDKIDDAVTDNKLKDLAIKYVALTTAVSTTASKVVTTDLDLS